MDFNIEVRRKQLENLDQFISSSKDRVDSILDYLGWTEEKVNESHKEMVNCIYDHHHRIPAAKASKHMQECSHRKEGYDKNEKLLSEPNFTPGSTILLDDTTKIHVLNQALANNPNMKTGWRNGEPNPKSSDRLLSVYTADERSALYNFAIASTSGPPTVPEFNVTESKKEKREHLTEAEIKMIERDAKRRRIKYKTKSVHTSRKTTTEIMREIINGQMEAYEDWIHHEITLETSSASTSVKPEPISPQSSKFSLEEERIIELAHSVRSLSKESNQSKYHDKYKHRERYHEASSHRSRERSLSHKRDKEHCQEYFSPKKHEQRRERSDRDRYRKESRERLHDGHFEEFRHEKEKHRNYKREYYDERFERRNEYEDGHRRGRSRERNRFKHREDRYRGEYDDRYYEDRMDRKNDCSVTVDN